MKHLATIQADFLKIAVNWENLSPEAQRTYLKKHPKSKRRLTVRQSEDDLSEDIARMVADVKKMKTDKFDSKAFDVIARKHGSGWLASNWVEFTKALKKEGIEIDLE
jgi:hypothetical protein